MKKEINGEIGTYREIKACKGVKALMETLLFFLLDLFAGLWALASLFCSLELARVLTQRFCQARNFAFIASKNIMLFFKMS